LPDLHRYEKGLIC